MKSLTIVTGLSGSGKSVALTTLEDEGYYCIDNLPSALVPDLLDKLLPLEDKIFSRIAIGIDMRSERHSTDRFLALIQQLRERTDVETDVLYLDTDRNTLATRFSETRRRHPLSNDEITLIGAIDQEIRLLQPVRYEADLRIDTSTLTLHDLRDIIRSNVLNRESSGLSLIFQSFGFKYGIPASTDFMFDVRCLPNPYWEAELREYSGKDQPIIDYLSSQSDVTDMYDGIEQFISRWLPVFEAENRSYLTVSIGCTGGRHRSVYLSEKLTRHFASVRGNVLLRHREIG